MKDVRTILAHAFDALTDIAKYHDLKADKLTSDEMCALQSDIAKLGELVGEAERRAAGHQVVTLYSIGKETAPGEYAGFTYGPVSSQADILEYVHENVLEDGDALVKSVQVAGVLNHVTLAIWFDNKWNATGDEPKEITA